MRDFVPPLTERCRPAKLHLIISCLRFSFLASLDSFWTVSLTGLSSCLVLSHEFTTTSHPVDSHSNCNHHPSFWWVEVVWSRRMIRLTWQLFMISWLSLTCRFICQCQGRSSRYSGRRRRRERRRRECRRRTSAKWCSFWFTYWWRWWIRTRGRFISQISSWCWHSLLDHETCRHGTR